MTSPNFVDENRIILTSLLLCNLLQNGILHFVFRLNQSPVIALES